MAITHILVKEGTAAGKNWNSKVQSQQQVVGELLMDEPYMFVGLEEKTQREMNVSRRLGVQTTYRRNRIRRRGGSFLLALVISMSIFLTKAPGMSAFAFTKQQQRTTTWTKLVRPKEDQVSCALLRSIRQQRPQQQSQQRLVPLDAINSRELRFYGEAATVITDVFGNSMNDFLASTRTAVSALAPVSDPDIVSSFATNTKTSIIPRVFDRQYIHHQNRTFTFCTCATTTTGKGDKMDKKDDDDDDDDSSSDKSHKTSVSTKEFQLDGDDVPLRFGAQKQPLQGYGRAIDLTEEERELFHLLREAREATNLTTCLRVAGGWVRDKLLATPEFSRTTTSRPGERLTSKFRAPSMGRQGTKVLGLQNENNVPVDIDIALDNMLGREFADYINAYFALHGRDTVSVGVVLKNPEKSKHLETATMKVGTFWIDFVNLRAEEYTQDSRIPDMMRIGTASEDAFRRDLTINSLFYNINTGQVEDWTGRGFEDLRRGVVATPLAALTTLLDDPLRVLRSIRFAARLRFTIDQELVTAATDERVHRALAQKVSRERVGGELDLMLRSPDPVGAMRLLTNLGLIGIVLPVSKHMEAIPDHLFKDCLSLMGQTHDHLCDCKVTPPSWCQANRKSYSTNNVKEMTLREDDESRRLLWYASFLKPIYDLSQNIKPEKQSQRTSKKSKRSIICKLLVDELKRPARDAESIGKILKAADDFTALINGGFDLSATLILISDVQVIDEGNGSLKCSINGRDVDSATEEDPVWQHAMEFRQLVAHVLGRVGPLWRAGYFLSLSEQLETVDADKLDYAIEGDVIDESKEEIRLGILEVYDAFAMAVQNIGLIGIWERKPLLNGREIKEVLPRIPKGPLFRDVMDEQERWMTTHPGAGKDQLKEHIQKTFPDFQKEDDE